MIKENCVLILGAGASAPYGFPTGAGLKSVICNQFGAVWEKFVWDRHQTPISGDYIEEQNIIAKKFVNDFRKFDHDSIDLFLDIFTEYADIGKKAIFLTILEAENKSKMKGRKKDWYTELFKRMIGTSGNYLKLSENKLTIITFNYDRSLENYLYNILGDFTNSITISEKIEELKKIKIYHVYGKLAELPWENENSCLEYGGNLWLNQLEDKKDNIKTIFERRKNTGVIDSIISSIESASKIYFLGFGFAQENVEMLSLKRNIKPGTLLYVSDFENRHNRTENQMRGLSIWHDNYVTVVKGGDCKRVIEDYLF
jgi:hypothetical protein